MVIYLQVNSRVERLDSHCDLDHSNMAAVEYCVTLIRNHLGPVGLHLLF